MVFVIDTEQPRDEIKILRGDILKQAKDTAMVEVYINIKNWTDAEIEHGSRLYISKQPTKLMATAEVVHLYDHQGCRFDKRQSKLAVWRRLVVNGLHCKQAILHGNHLQMGGSLPGAFFFPVE